MNDDTIKVKKLLLLAGKYQKLHLKDSALKNFNLAYSTAEKLKMTRSMANISASKGAYLREMSSFLESNAEYTKALVLSEKLEDKTNISFAYNYLGMNYTDLGEMNKALEHFMKSLKIKEELNDRKGISTTYNGLGSLFLNKEDYEKAIYYFSQSLVIKQELNDKRGIAICLNNLGNAYNAMNNNDKAYDYYLKSMKLKEESGDKKSLTSTYANIGIIHKQKGEYEKALEYYQKAVKNDIENNITSGLVGAYANMVNVFLIQKKYKEAEELISKADEIAKASGSKEDKVTLESTKMRLDTAIGDFKSAFLHQNSAYKLEKSMIKQQNTQSVAELLTQYESSKKEQQIAMLNKDKTLKMAEIEKQTITLQKNQQNLLLLENENKIKELNLNRQQEELEKKNMLAENQKKNIDLLNKDKALNEAEAKQKESQLKLQRNVLYFVSAGAVLVLILLAVAYRGYMHKKKSNKILAIQKKQVEEQKALVDAKQKEILDSIKYARRIQTSLMPTQKYFEKYLTGQLKSKEKHKEIPAKKS